MEKNYAQIQKETLSIIFGLQKFHEFFMGRKFCLITDYKPLLTIFHPAKGIPEMAARRLYSSGPLFYLPKMMKRSTYQPSDKYGHADTLWRLLLDSDISGIDAFDDSVY